MNEETVKEGILAFIQSEIAYPGTEVTDETDLFDAGVLDSLMLLRLILYLETTYSIAFSPDDLSGAAFARVPSMSALVVQRAEAHP